MIYLKNIKQIFEVRIYKVQLLPIRISGLPNDCGTFYITIISRA